MDGFWFLFKEIFLHFVEFQVQSFVIITVYTGPSLTLSWKKGLTPPFTVPGMESTVIRLLTRDYNQRPPTTLRSSAIQTIRQSSYFWAKIPFYFSYLYYLTIRLHIFTPFSLIFFPEQEKKNYKILIPEKIMRHKNAKFKSFLWKSEKRIAQKDEKRVSFIPLSLSFYEAKRLIRVFHHLWECVWNIYLRTASWIKRIRERNKKKSNVKYKFTWNA